MDKVAFELVAPERLLAREQADMVVIPGADGDFGVLPEHAPFMSLLRPGVITIYQGDKPSRRLFIEGGVAEVNPSACTVLAEQAVPMDELNLQDAQRQLQNAREDLADKKEPSEIERARLEAQVAIGEARVEALEAGAAH
jgi:F-type H+-transporting ATPase subunit epsilon